MEALCEKLKPRYRVLLRHISLYSKKNRPIGEIDILAVDEDGFCDIYEVKCSYRLAKAKRQLQRLKRAASHKYPLRHLFFYCGNSEVLVKCS